MEVREILIANTKTQKRSKITTAATTLGELKEALTEAGIDYSDMTFTEGISKTQLLEDATQLPQNVMYKGAPTNNLVILLTNTKKKIASGATMSRAEAYALIKKRGVQEAIKNRFGRNFTQVPTADLEQFLNSPLDDNGNITTDAAKPSKTEDTAQVVKHVETKEKNTESSENVPADFVDKVNSLIYAFNTLVDILEEDELICEDKVEKLRRAVSEECKVKPVAKDNTPVSNAVNSSVSTSDGQINDDDIDKMLSELRM